MILTPIDRWAYSETCIYTHPNIVGVVRCIRNYKNAFLSFLDSLPQADIDAIAANKAQEFMQHNWVFHEADYCEETWQGARFAGWTFHGQDDIEEQLEENGWTLATIQPYISGRLEVARGSV